MINSTWICGLGVILSQSFSHIILTLLALLAVICAIVIFFSVQLKRVNRKLKERNKQISDINTELQKSNKELTIQKELIAKKHFESDKFY
ncbi:MAG: hypothetical protein ABR927_11670, partial [Bacteroidales bacterium]